MHLTSENGNDITFAYIIDTILTCCYGERRRFSQISNTFSPYAEQLVSSLPRFASWVTLNEPAPIGTQTIPGSPDHITYNPPLNDLISDKAKSAFKGPNDGSMETGI